MLKRVKNSTGYFLGSSLVIFLVVQLLLSTGILNNFWRGIIFWGAAITMVTLGLNLIFGFNGQFSLGQYGFYAIGAYGAADVTYRWVHDDPSGIVVVFFGILLSLLLYALVSNLLRRFLWRYRDDSVFRLFAFYHIGFLGVGAAVTAGARSGNGTVLGALPEVVSRQIVFFVALFGGAGLAGIVSFLFGIPVLELGSDYFGIATLGFHHYCQSTLG